MIEAVKIKGLGSLPRPPVLREFIQLGWPWEIPRALEERKIREGLKAQSELANVHELLAPHAELPKILAEARDGVYFVGRDASTLLPLPITKER
jgi:hypothetical protein